MSQPVLVEDEPSHLGDALPLAFIDLVACAGLAAALLRSSPGWSTVGSDSPDRIAARNAELAHRLEFDGYDPLAMGHPATVLVPALLAVWEATGDGSGRDLARAFDVGMAAATRLAAMVGPSMVESGLHPTAELGAVAAGVACRALLDGQVGMTAHEAIAEFGRRPTSRRADFGTPEKARRVGEAAGEAVAYALGTRPAGRTDAVAFYRQLGASDKALGTRLDGQHRLGIGTVFKHLPVCGYLLPTLTIASALRSDVRAQGGLASLALTIPETVTRDVGPLVPPTLDAARFSLRFLTWLVLDDGHPSRYLLSEQAFADALGRFELLDANGELLVRSHPDSIVNVTVGTANGATLSTAGDPRRALRSLNRLGVERKLRLAVNALGRPAFAAEQVLALAAGLSSVTGPEYRRVLRAALCDEDAT